MQVRSEFDKDVTLKINKWNRALWLTPVIPVLQEAEIRRIVVQTSQAKKVESPPQPRQLNRKKLGVVAHGKHK
jgi:hypothetical protein